MESKRINITAGDCLNDILRRRYPEETFVPFREAMIEGRYAAPLFSAAFIRERAAFHGVGEAEYREKLAGFLDVLARPEAYDEIVLWFGDEPFCVENRETVLAALKQSGYRGSILLNTVIEETGDILQQDTLPSFEA